MPKATSVSVVELGAGGGYAIWGFRAAAVGYVQCPALVRGYNDVFGEYGRPALEGLHMLAREIGNSGGRRVTIAYLGCGCATADELSIVALLSAAQEKDDVLREAHLSWLMCGRCKEGARTAATVVGETFGAAGMRIERPQVEFARPSAVKSFTTFHETGHA